MTTYLPPPPKQLAPVVDAPRLVHLKFEITYVECNLAPRTIENHPVLQVFLGDQFVRDWETGGVVNLKLNEEDLSWRYDGSLVGTLKREHREMPPMAGIGFDSYAVHRNEQGHKCYVNAGTSYALLSDVLRDVHTKGVYDRNHELTLHTVVVTGSEPIKKGIINVRIIKAQVGPALVATVNSFISGNAAVGALQGDPEQVAATLNTYVESTVALEQTMPDTLRNTDRMHAFNDISETGAQMLKSPGIFLPVAAFAIIETPRANEGFFLNAYQCVMKRRGLTIGNWHDFDTKEKARTWSLIMCEAVQTFDYIGDAVEMSSRMEKIMQRRHVGNEEFSMIWNSLAGDCEDGEHGIAATCKAFSRVTLQHPDLREMQIISREYIKLGTLSVVHGAKIGDEEGYGAHMYLPMMPKHQWFAALQRSPQGRQFCERILPATPLISADPADAWKSELPFLFGEGTGRIDCLGRYDPIIDQRRYIAMQMPSVAGFKKEIPRAEGAPSTFYFANLLGITDQFMEENGVPVGGFIFCQVNGDGSLSRGCLFEDMVNGKSNIAIVPQPPVPAPVMAMIGEAVALRPPARPLEFHPERKVAGPARDPHLDRYVASVKQLGRKAPAIPPAEPVDMIIRPHQYGANIVQQMIYETQQLERIYDASYEVEHVTNDIYHYRLKLWVK